jgi:hypothetical protein
LNLILEKLAEMRKRRSSVSPRHPKSFWEAQIPELASTPYEIVYEEDRVKVKNYVRQ